MTICKGVNIVPFVTLRYSVEHQPSIAQLVEREAYNVSWGNKHERSEYLFSEAKHCVGWSLMCPPVAQLVEREAYTFVVPGSSPGGRTQ